MAVLEQELKTRRQLRGNMKTSEVPLPECPGGEEAQIPHDLVAKVEAGHVFTRGTRYDNGDVELTCCLCGINALAAGGPLGEIFEWWD